MSQPPNYYSKPSGSYNSYDSSVLANQASTSSAAQYKHSASTYPEDPLDSFQAMDDPFEPPSRSKSKKSAPANDAQTSQAYPGYQPTSYPITVSNSNSTVHSQYKASTPFEDVLAEDTRPGVEHAAPMASTSSYPYLHSYDSDLEQYGGALSDKPRDIANEGVTTPLVLGDTKPNNRRSAASDFEPRGRVDPMGYQDPYNAADYEGASPPISNATQKPPNFFEKVFGGSALRDPIEQRIDNRRRGVTKQKYPFLAWGLSVIMVGIMIYELVYNDKQQGNPFSFKPYANVMLGPSQVGLITLGARWPACMRDVPAIPTTLTLGCPSNTANPPTKLCTVEQICAFGGFHDKTANQWWRFITPIFLHAGLVHIAFNLFAQLTLSAQVEKEIGSVAFFILYFAAGIFGNVLGGNFALVGLPSVGASGAIFGTVGVQWVDLLAHWGLERQPGKKLAFLILDLVVGIGLGFIPGVDNFVHLGGFLLGLICAAIFYPVISTTKRHKSIMWGVRLAMLPLAIVLYVVLIRNFYSANPFDACSWCRYLSCIPTSSNNRCQGTGITTTTTST